MIAYRKTGLKRTAKIDGVGRFNLADYSSSRKFAVHVKLEI
jgi:hypothetical protein